MCWLKRAGVEPLQRGDARVALYARMQLSMADIDGDDMARAARQQHIGEAARRSAYVEAIAPERVDVKSLQRMRQLDAAARDPGVGRRRA